jgi:hypothetical protein
MDKKITFVLFALVMITLLVLLYEPIGESFADECRGRFSCCNIRGYDDEVVVQARSAWETGYKTKKCSGSEMCCYSSVMDANGYCSSDCSSPLGECKEWYTEDEKVWKIKTIENCCGNDECEQAENCNSCEVDCGSCLESNI